MTKETYYMIKETYYMTKDLLYDKRDLQTRRTVVVTIAVSSAF